ncbi:MAG: hypothetical protein AXA67_09170 [Methylothermaceae bacteria B42]|nr:MAG: hypothetical protein AXA67_09170 [Methylothermaceae bacteria B42]HHJ39474.1 glycosyltransferase [Methylothermaceae bacterium]
MKSALILFTKAPVPGEVKTRLTPVLSPQQAAALQARLTFNLIELLAGSAIAPIHLYCHPTIHHPFFQALAKRFALFLHPQQGADLGEKMHHAFEEMLGLGYRQALLAGCDSPSLTVADFRQGIQALNQGKDIVLAPAEDGGYVMIGLRRPCRDLFTAMPWGTEAVLSETRRRIRQFNLDCFELPLQWDLDRPEDWRRWRTT